MSKTTPQITKLRLDKIECEDAILCLMKDGRGNGYLFVRGVLEGLITKIDSRIESAQMIIDRAKEEI